MSDAQVIIIGAGFTGLTAALDLVRQGRKVTVFESEPVVGGLASSFLVEGTQLEKFYHHWFTNDEHVLRLVAELGVEDEIVLRPTRTGMYYANQFYRLSKPTELLRFTPLSFVNRLRLGLLALRARAVRDWRVLENVSARDWLLRMGGAQVFQVVWEPLLRGKFGDCADDISAVWFWNKLKLRGGSRGKGGAEMLAYYRGGFAALAQRIAAEVTAAGGRIVTRTPVQSLQVQGNRVTGVIANGQSFPAESIIATPALPIVADLIAPHVSPDYVASLRRIRYLGNVCVVLELDRSLSDTYWLNINDPSFPFVGVIEHTNFEPPENYGGRHIVYLSKYLPVTDALYTMADAAVFDYCVPYLQRMFPAFIKPWVQRYHVWRAQYSQPVVERNYSQLLPAMTTPIEGLYLSTMAQIYPEDRGTNYAIREGRKVAALVAAQK
jgi:protoporphyrinogen oxidase